jgi:hypothetical protein
MTLYSLSNEDQIFLDEFVDSFKRVFMAVPNFMGGVASINHQPLYLARLSAEFGVSAEELFKLFQSPLVTNLFDEVVSTQQAKKLLVVRSFSNYLAKIFVASWLPVINPQTQNIVAIMVDAHPLEVCNISSILARFYKYGDTKIHSLDTGNLSLTEREKQVIFFFMLNFSSQDIADLIAKIEAKVMSKNAIDQMFNKQLLPKFGVYSRKALYDKLQDLGYDRLLPHNVLQEGFILDVSDYVVFA